MNHQAQEASSSPSDLSSLASRLRTVWYRVTRGLANRPELHGVQRQQFWVLWALSAGPKRMSTLAECSQTSQASLTGIVDRMEEHGLVERRRGTDDRRVVEVAATDAGRAVLQSAHEEMVSGLQELLDPLTPQERDEFARLLGKLTDPPPRD